MVLLALLTVSLPTHAQQAQHAQYPPLPPECGSLDNAYGPYDYTDPVEKANKLPIVEAYHFNSDVYSLIKGMTDTTPLQDLDYTLRAFPNHHLALDAMARLYRRDHSKHLPGERFPLECWFTRARAFQPTDGVVPMIFGIHLFLTGRLNEAEQQLTVATKLLPDSAEAHYNLGLLHVRMKKYAAAREQAEIAYRLGYPLPGLREQLKRAGEWRAAN